MVPPNLARKEVVPFRGYALGALVALYFLVWVFVARGLPSADKLLTYQPPLPTMVRGADGEIVSSYARERRVQLRFVDFPEPLINAFLSAEDKTFWTHGGVDYTGLPGGGRLCHQVRLGRARAGRVHHHPAGRQEHPDRQRIFGHAQAQGNDPGPAHRGRADQAADP
jgi:membrane peptidoglycan carboxypeptidase